MFGLFVADADWTARKLAASASRTRSRRAVVTAARMLIGSVTRD
jgi:hypothetical protein